MACAQLLACAGMQGGELEYSNTSYVILDVSLQQRSPQAKQGDKDYYLQQLKQTIPTILPQFPDVVTNIIVAYIKRDERQEKLHSIGRWLKTYRTIHCAAGAVLLGCATEASLGITALITHQWHLIPQSSLNNIIAFVPTLMAAMPSGVLVSLCLPCFDCVDVDNVDNEDDNLKNSIIATTSTLALGVFTLSLSALVSPISLEGSATVLCAGGLLGTINATRLLVKNCLRSRWLARRSQQLAEE